MNRFLVDRLRARLADEVGTMTRPSAASTLRIALAYPNRYYIGMSNVGFQAVYKFWNELPDVVCERVFLPDTKELSEHERTGTPLLSLETQTPVREFDVLAFSVTFEPDELNLVRMLDLAGITALAEERGPDEPLVLAGGPVTFLNPEPMAPFLDVVAIGEAEALLPPLTDALRRTESRRDILEELHDGEGFYVPSLRRESEGKLVRAKMGKRADLPPPATYVLTPGTEMSNKFLVEVSRGCPTLCRFCWAGFNYLPKRSFQVERILEVAREARAHTRDIGLVSTAVGAHKEIVPLAEALRDMGFRISVSSLRFEDLRQELLDPLSGSGERTLAVAPEVGTDELRFKIHKRVTNDEILEKTELIFDRGIENLKLYLMIGAPDGGGARPRRDRGPRGTRSGPASRARPKTWAGRSDHPEHHLHRGAAPFANINGNTIREHGIGIRVTEGSAARIGTCAAGRVDTNHNHVEHRKRHPTDPATPRRSSC